MILKKIEEFDSKLLIMNRFEEKIDKFQLQLAENEERMKNYMDEVSKDLQLKASAEVLRLIAKSAQRRNKLLLLKLASSIQVVNRWNNQNITIQRWNRGTEE